MFRLPVFVFVLLCAGCSITPSAAPVQTGIDVLHRDGYRALEGLRVGLITNHTGIDRAGVSTVERLHAAGNLQLVRLFSPEHGIAGRLDQAVVGDSVDAGRRLAIVSLYGQHRKPTPAMLDDLDALVFDIQDIGTRFYTYISTMGLAMQAASDAGLRFVVLDRPNPITGAAVGGPVLDVGSESFTAFHRLPVRHGMTVGELARLFDAELDLNLDLQVVEVEGWQRSDWYDETGLRWINPSPNMRSLDAALLYPGIGLLETTNLSVGRGTTTPFELFGAPWLDGERLAAWLSAANLDGLVFAPLTFTPDASKFAGERCSGVRITITDRERADPLALGFAVAHYLATRQPADWDSRRYPRLLGHADVYDAVLAGADLPAIRRAYAAELEAFRERRRAYLLYD